MGFESVGNVANYAKMKYTQTKWNQRKANGFTAPAVKSAGATSVPGVPMLADKDAVRQQGLQKTEAKTPNEIFKETFGYDPEKQAISTHVEMISTKLKAGTELSGADLEFLKENAPELYEKAMQIAQERKQYEEALARCKTKDDVQRVNTQRLSAYMNEGHSIMRSNMTRAQKLEKMEFLGMRVNAIRNEHAQFVASPEYEKLPWEHELAEEDDRRRDEARVEDEDKNEIELKWLEEELKTAGKAEEQAFPKTEDADPADPGEAEPEPAARQPHAEAPAQPERPARAPRPRGTAVHGGHHMYNQSGAVSPQPSPAAAPASTGAAVSVKA